MTESNSTPKERIIQHHSGPGDNVREKHVHQTIAPSAIQKPIEDILTSLRHRNIDSAKEKLSSLQAASQLDTATTAILSTVSALVDLAHSAPPEDSYSIAESCLRSSPNGFFSDIATSLLMRLDVHGERLEDANQRYVDVKPPGEYSQEVFFEFLASSNFLDDLFSSSALKLSEITLCGLTRGLLRCESLELSIEAANRLKSTYPSFNSKVVSLITRCNHFSINLSAAHYWLITRHEKEQVMVLADETIALLEKSQGKDKRLIVQAVGFLKYLAEDHNRLIDVCWRFITTIEQIDPDIGSFLRSLKERNSVSLSGPLSELNKAERDFSYRKSLIKRLTESTKISQEQFFILSHIAKSDDIAHWLNGGGEVNTSSDLEKKFVAIELLCYQEDGSPTSKNEIKRAVANLVSSHPEELSQLNPRRLLALSDQLSEASLAPQVCSLLKPILPAGDLWLSPLARIYITALVNSHQLTTLKTVLTGIPEEDWCEFLWEIKARQLDHINDISGAINAMESALSLAPDLITLWHYFIYLHKKNQTPKEEYADILEKIPDKLFSHPSRKAWPILFEISCNNGYYRVEDILIKWFLEDPDGCAKEVTDFHFSKAAIEREKKLYEPSKTTDICIGGFNYLAEGKRVSKLIVRNIESNHSALLKNDSPLGSLLLTMQVGETIDHGMQEITLVEVLPPYVAILRLALDLRQNNNDGSDCFYQFSLPEDPEEMVRSLEKKLLLSTDDTEETICSNPEIPIFLKGHRFERGCPVHAALKQYCSSLSIKHPLPNLGESQPKQIILDVYATVYLGLTGLIHGLVQSNTTLAITKETKSLLEAFLENISRDDYMRMGIDKYSGKIQITTSEHVQTETADVQIAIKHTIEAAEVTDPRLIDMPPDIIYLRDFIDPSVYSSLTLSISNDIPWLCVDPIFAQLSKVANYPVANALQFFMSISTELDIEKKQRGLYRHVSCGLPYPLTYEEILQLSRSKDQHAHYFLAKLLKMYPDAYPNTEAAILHLHKILVIVLAQAYVDGEILRGLVATNPRNSGYTEQVFNTCCRLAMHHSDGKKAEHKLALLLYAVFEQIGDIPTLRNLTKKLASVFIAGHFMSFDAVNAHIHEITSTKQ